MQKEEEQEDVARFKVGREIKGEGEKKKNEEKTLKTSDAEREGRRGREKRFCKAALSMRC